jgi:Rod binding domain-containing protein
MVGVPKLLYFSFWHGGHKKEKAFFFYKSGGAMKVSSQSPSFSQESDIQQASSAIEELFVDFLLQSMRKTVPKTETSPAADLYTGMLDSHIAKQISQQGNFGLAQQLIDSLSQDRYTESNQQTHGRKD